MNSLYEGRDHDFEAEITILSEQECGRRPGFNGIRWDFKYAAYDEDDIYMIWAEFFSVDGELFPRDIPLSGTLPARMQIVVAEMKEEVHNQRIEKGVEFYMVEGPHIVARGVVTSGIRG